MGEKERGERGENAQSMHKTRTTATRRILVPITDGTSLSWSELVQEVEKFQKGRSKKSNGV